MQAGAAPVWGGAPAGGVGPYLRGALLLVLLCAALAGDPCEGGGHSQSLWEGFGWRDGLGLGLAAVGLMVAAGGGIGGGGILVPIYILVMQFSPKKAIPLSNVPVGPGAADRGQVTILGGSLSNMWLNAQKRHPRADRPLIDFDLANLMEPLTIAGAVVGSVLNKVLVPWLITGLLVLLLGLTALNTLRKAQQLHQKESEQAGCTEEGRELTSRWPSAVALQSYGTAGGKPAYLAMHADELDAARLEGSLQTLLELERHVPWDRVLVLVVCFVGTISFTIAKGKAVDCGGPAYWTLTFLPVPFAVAISLFVRRQLLRAHQYKVSLGYKYQEGDVLWTNRATIVFPLLCSLAGLFAGLFGIGGGIVKGPLMLAMNVHPAVASATAAYKRCC